MAQLPVLLLVVLLLVLLVVLLLLVVVVLLLVVVVVVVLLLVVVLAPLALVADRHIRTRRPADAARPVSRGSFHQSRYSLSRSPY